MCCVVNAVDDVGRPFALGCCLDPRLGLSLLTVDCISPDMHTWSSMSRDYSFRCLHEKKWQQKNLQWNHIHFFSLLFLFASSTCKGQLMTREKCEKETLPISTEVSLFLNWDSLTAPGSTPRRPVINEVSSGWEEPPKTFVFLTIVHRKNRDNGG